MNEDIDPQDNLRDLIAVDHRELNDDEARFESATMNDYLEG